MNSDENTVPAVTTPNADDVAHRLAYRGRTGEFVGLWLVQTLLALVTLGLYHPWRKVSLRRHLNERTFLADAHFEYHAEPLSLLGGVALLAIGVFALIFFGRAVVGVPDWLLTLTLLMIFPALAAKGHAFNASNTGYRGFRFAMRPAPGAAYLTYAAIPLLLASTSGLGFVIADYVNLAYVKRYLTYGDRPFVFRTNYKFFAGCLLKVMGLGASVTLVGLGTAALVGQVLIGNTAAVLLIVGAVIVSAYAIFGLAYVNAKTFNRDCETLSIAHVRFRAELVPTELGILYATNLLAIVATVGLALPWAIIRTYRYRVERVIVLGDLEALALTADAEPVTGGAVGDAALGMMMLNIGC